MQNPIGTARREHTHGTVQKGLKKARTLRLAIIGGTGACRGNKGINGKHLNDQASEEKY